MPQVLQRVWQDDQGAVIASELLFIITILVIGSIVGLTNLRQAITIEMTELGNALLALSQGFSISGSSGAGGGVDGSESIDTPGMLQNPVSTPPSAPSVIDVYTF